MIHARKDYTSRIQWCDLAALQRLCAELISAVRYREVFSDQQINNFIQRLSAALESHIPADEPVFLIRAQDAVGAAAVREWARLHRVNGGSEEAYAAAMDHADKMEAWPKKKRADVPQEAL